MGGDRHFITQLNTKIANRFYGIITNPSSSLSNPTVSYNQLLKPFDVWTMSPRVGLTQTWKLWLRDQCAMLRE